MRPEVVLRRRRRRRHALNVSLAVGLAALAGSILALAIDRLLGR